MSDEGSSIGLLIPIVVLVIVMFGIGERWLMVPIAILSIILVANLFTSRKIRSREEVAEPVIEDVKPIYDQKKQKDEGITCGTFIPIIILGWLYLQSSSWVFLIPLFILLVSLIGSLYNQGRGKSEVKEVLASDVRGSVSDISSRTGVPEEKVRQHIVREKRSGSADVWFDSSSGELTSTPIQSTEEPTKKKVGCSYCGFALKPEDRFCPFCGAPIRV